MKKDYGKIAVTNGGIWDEQTPYEKLTTVSRNGQAYLSFVDNVGVDPEQDCDPITGIGTKWFRIATKGDPGTTDYNDLVNKPLIPTALSELIADALHRTVSDQEKTTWNGKYTKPSTGIPESDLASNVQQQIDSVPSIQQHIEAIAAIVPEQASTENQLADKDFVNSSVSTATADFKGTFNSLEDLERVTANANDYAFVIANDAAGNTVYKRYKWVVGIGWTWEYDLNNSSFTAAQWASINSGIVGSDVTKLNALPTKPELDTLFATKQDALVSGTNIKTINNQSILGSGNLEVKDVFIAEYGVTTYQEIKDAVDGGKFVICHNVKYDLNFYYQFGGYQLAGLAVVFYRLVDFDLYSISVTIGNIWSSDDVKKTLEIVDNKVTNLNSPNNTKYPTTRAVADYVSGIVGDINSILDTI